MKPPSGAVDFSAGRKSGRARGYIGDYRPQKKTLVLLSDAAWVLREYHDYWPLTIRQIFYRLVGAKGYPKTEDFYNKLCHHLGNARRARTIPFRAIRDDGVSVVDVNHWDDRDHFLRHVRELGEAFERNKLANQPYHIEVWCEAAGMVFQLSEVAEKYSIKVYSCSGFDSLTAKKELASRICSIGKPAMILHLGDYDPSGESMFVAVAEDVAAFVEADRPWSTVTVRFHRVALTAEQVVHYELPTAPPKTTDSRSRVWVGETCQLEALTPTQIADLLETTITDLIDDRQYQHDCRMEVMERQWITRSLPPPGGTR